MPPSRLLLLLKSLQLFCFTIADDSLVALSNANFSRGPALGEDVQSREISSLPGWQLAGTVQYVRSPGNASLPGLTRGVQLGKDGFVSQAFSVEPGSVYSLTFTLTSAGENCSTIDLLNVSVTSSSSSFLLEGRFSEGWESHAWGFDAVDSHENLTFSNQLNQEPVQQDPNVTCGPVLEGLFLKKLAINASSSGNLLMNGGFEEGPYTLPGSSYGVLLEDITDSRTSPLPGWTVEATVKYIDSTHFSVPQGNAAIELVAGPGAGVHQSINSTVGADYTLSFELGDGKDLCFGNMSVQVLAAGSSQNFSYNSLGKGSSQNFSMSFRAESDTTNISILNLLRNENEDFLFCGPVIDNVILAPSSSASSSTIAIASYLCFSILMASLPAFAFSLPSGLTGTPS